MRWPGFGPHGGFAKVIPVPARYLIKSIAGCNSYRSALMVDMPEHPSLKRDIKETCERPVVVGAVCHGPVSLLNVRPSDGAYLRA